MNIANYLLELSAEWERLAVLTTMEEVQQCCERHALWAQADLRESRRWHHRHILKQMNGY